VFKVNYGKYTQNRLYRVFSLSAAWGGIHSSVTRREHEIVGRVAIGPVYYVPPAEHMEEASIRTSPDILVA
jgi:hypothetical protein